MMSAKNIQDRIRFSRRILDAGYLAEGQEAKNLLDHVLFTDESIIELFPRPNAQNTRIRTSNVDLRSPIGIPKYDLKIIIAGGICANGLTELHICDADTTVTGEYYRQSILPVYFAPLEALSADRSIYVRRPFPTPTRVVFMQDGAPAHTARATLRLLGSRFTEIWRQGNMAR